jgi:hypothetical protein
VVSVSRPTLLGFSGWLRLFSYLLTIFFRWRQNQHMCCLFL